MNIDLFYIEDPLNKAYNLHHNFITFLVNYISYKEYHKVTNIESEKTIYIHFCLNYEGSKQVKESKRKLFDQKHELFKMGEE